MRWRRSGAAGPIRRNRVVTMGVFRNAPYYDIAGLAARFCAVDPEARLNLPGQNSADVATAVRAGELEAGLVVLPVDDRVLDVRRLFRDEVVVVSVGPGRTRRRLPIAKLADAPLILYDASHGFDDPTRRQFAAAAQEAGVRLTPRVEVEHIETALQLVCTRPGRHDRGPLRPPHHPAARERVRGQPHRPDPRLLRPHHPPRHDAVAGHPDPGQPRRRLGRDRGGADQEEGLSSKSSGARYDGEDDLDRRAASCRTRGGGR